MKLKVQFFLLQCAALLSSARLLSCDIGDSPLHEAQFSNAEAFLCTKVVFGERAGINWVSWVTDAEGKEMNLNEGRVHLLVLMEHSMLEYDALAAD